MLGLLDNDPNEAPPVFTFSSLLALLSAAGTIYVQLYMGWAVLTAHPAMVLLTILMACCAIAAGVVITAVLSGIAIYFRPARWGLIALGSLLTPMPVLLIPAVTGFRP